MNLQQKLTVATYIGQLVNKTHDWGNVDCCTVFLQYHDALWGTEKAKEVIGRYKDRKGAMNFYKNMKLTWRQWLFVNKYEKVDGALEEGDVAVLDHKLFPTVYIYHNGAFWVMSEEQNLSAFDAQLLRDHAQVSVWRHK